MHYYSPGDRVYRQIAIFQTFTRSYQTILAYRTTDSLNVPSFLFQTLWPICKILKNRTKKFNVFCFLLSFVALWCQMVGKYFLWIILRGLLIKIRSQYLSEDDVTIVNSFVVNCSGPLWKKRASSCLLNTLDSTRFYVGSYARDARLRPSKAVQFLSTMVALPPGGSGGHGRPPSSART